MGRGPQAEAIPDLARALRHLRERAGLSARGLSDRVAERGGSVSAVYYRQIEAGRRFPSPPARTAILEALDSSDVELANLLRERPWVVQEPPDPVDDWTAEDLIAAITAAAPALTGSQRRLVAGLARELVVRR